VYRWNWQACSAVWTLAAILACAGMQQSAVRMYDAGKPSLPTRSLVMESATLFAAPLLVAGVPVNLPLWLCSSLCTSRCWCHRTQLTAMQSVARKAGACPTR